jgi:CheY-like chemotaxis protein
MRREMPETATRILVVEDEQAFRLSISLILTHFGYMVRSAADGFSALYEIRLDMPDILLTDLNMPGMPGVELLAVVWRRFPSIQKIAMSDASFGDEVPPGIAADAFYQKGSTITTLLHIIRALPKREFRAPQPSSVRAPSRIHRIGHEPWVTIECPECMRSFSQVNRGISGFMRETDCVHCGNSVQYAIVDPPRSLRFQPLDRGTSAKLRTEQN